MNERIPVARGEETSSLSVRRTVQTITYGGTCVGTLDGLAATINAGLKGVSPDRVFHYIASGLIGRDASYNGGAATIVLGVFLHFTIAFGVVTVFLFLSRRFPVLLRRPVISGMVYGIVVYFVMGYLIVPLSAVPKISFSFAGMLTGLAIHMLCVGLPAALIVRSRSKTGRNRIGPETIRIASQQSK
jgi:hypothetical protein